MRFKLNRGRVETLDEARKRHQLESLVNGIADDPAFDELAMRPLIESLITGAPVRELREDEIRDYLAKAPHHK